MLWNRSIRVSSTIGLTLALALGALAAPAFVSAKPAPLEFGVGPGFDTAKTTGAMPLMVSPGSTVAFEVWARNKGGSNIAKLFLTARTDAAFDGFVLTNTGNTKGSCSGGPGGGVALRCSWKPFKPGATTRVLPDPHRAGERRLIAGQLRVEQHGLRRGPQQQPRRPVHQERQRGDERRCRRVRRPLDQAGQHRTLVVQTNQDLGEGNPQSTKVHAPKDDIPVTVAEDDDISDCTELLR